MMLPTNHERVLGSLAAVITLLILPLIVVIYKG